MTKVYVAGISLISIIVFCIYWQGLGGPLLLDDGPQILPLIRNITHANGIQDYKKYIVSNSGTLGRPVSMLTFIFNAMTSGDNIWYWKLTNVFLHMLCGVSIYILTSLILSFNEENNSRLVGLCIATIWLLHPLHVSTILYLVQRMTILSALFTISSLTCFVYAFKKEIKKESGTLLLIISAFILFPLAIFSKENAALLPLYVVLTTSAILISTKSSYASLPNNIKAYNNIAILFMLIGLIILIVRYDEFLLNGYKLRNFTVFERLLTESRVVVLYLFQILVPVSEGMGFFHDDILISKNILEPVSTLASVVFIFMILFIAFRNIKHHPLIWFGILFFFTSHILESTIFPLEITFEHRNYIGMWGIILSAILAISLIIKKTTTNPVLINVTVCLVLAGLTFQRAKIWGDQAQLFPHMLSIHPESKRLHAIFASSYASSKQYNKALEFLANDKTFRAELQKLVILCQDKGTIDIGTFIKSEYVHPNIKIRADEMEGIITLSNFGLDEICIFSMHDFIKLLTTIYNTESISNTNAQKLLLYLAHYHHKVGDNYLAIKALKGSFERDMTNPIPLFLATEWLVEHNELDAAIKIFSQAKSVARSNYRDFSDFTTRINVMLEH